MTTFELWYEYRFLRYAVNFPTDADHKNWLKAAWDAGHKVGILDERQRSTHHTPEGDKQ
jgi:hypothetical protein